jgi:hypothetical protein
MKGIFSVFLEGHTRLNTCVEINKAFPLAQRHFASAAPG